MEDRPGELARAVVSLASSTGDAGPMEPLSHSTREAVESATIEDSSVRWIEGRVVFPPGTPADERAFVVDRSQVSASRSARRVPVAADGSFRLPFPAKARGGRLGLEARYLYLEQGVSWRRDEADRVLLEPELGARLVGELRPPEGVEASGLGGVLELWVKRHAGPLARIEERDVTGHSSFALEGLWLEPARVYSLRYVGERFLGALEGLHLEPGQTLSVELALRPGITLAGVVNDVRGEPLAGVQVRACSRPSAAALLGHWSEATSAADGTFRVGALVGGRVELVAEHAGFLPLARDLGELTEGTAVDDLVLVLDAGLSIAGAVRWPDGSPASAEVVLVPWSPGPESESAAEELETESGPGGGFVFGGLASGEYRLKAWGTHTKVPPLVSPTRIRAVTQYTGWFAEVERVAAGAHDLVLTLASGLTIEGTVVDEVGAPLQRFTLEALAIGGRGRGGQLSRRFVEAAGAFRMEGLSQGDWYLQVDAPGHATSRMRVVLPVAEPLELVIPREAAVRGVVLDRSGAPVPRAGILVRQPRTSFQPRELIADAQGRFEIEGLGPTAMTLQAHDHFFAVSEPLSLELRAGERIENLQLALREGGWTRFHVRQGGLPVDAVLTILDASGARHRTIGLGIGELRFGPAVPGTYTVRARRDEQTIERSFEVVAGRQEQAIELAFD